MCAPSRASFLSGKYTHNHHVYTHLEPYGFAVVQGPAHDRHRPAGGGLPTALVGKYLNGYGEQYLHSDKPSLRYIPPGWDQWYAGSDHLWDYDDPNYGGGTYSYFKLIQNINGQIQIVPEPLLHRRARRRGPSRHHRLRQVTLAVVPVVDADRPAPRSPRGSPTTRSPPDDATGSSASGTRPVGRTGSRAASTRGSRTAPGTPLHGSAEKDVT